jgi:hypothetical protein
MKNLQVKISVSEQTKKALQHVAIDQGKSLSDYLRDCLQEYFNKNGIEIDLQAGLSTHGGYRERKTDAED